MKVSIIIPVYNKEKYLRRTLESVINQTYKDFELLLIDDGSTDNSKKIIESFSEDQRIIYIYQPNSGVSSARNKGISIASGDYITFLDADDTWEEHFLAEMLKNVKGFEVCYCGHNNVVDNQKKKARIKFNSGKILAEYLNNITTPHTNSWLICREFIKKNKITFPNDLQWGEDMIFFTKVLVHSKQIRYTNKYLTNYFRDVKGNLSENVVEKIDEDILWMNRALEYIKKNDSNTNYHEAKKIIKNYRLPAAILYRIDLLLSQGKNQDAYKAFYAYKKCFEKIKLTNGIRSLKLIFLKYKIKNKLK